MSNLGRAVIPGLALAGRTAALMPRTLFFRHYGRPLSSRRSNARQKREAGARAADIPASLALI